MTESRAPLRAAFAIFRLSPAGGLEQHALRLAKTLAERGCEVTVVTTRAPDLPLPPGVGLSLIAERGSTNHGRILAFVQDAARAVAGRYQRTVSFHAAPGFDFVFCAHPSRGKLGLWQNFAPRYRTFARLERQAFAVASGSRIFCLSSAQRDELARNHGTGRERLLLLPPTVERPAAADPPTPQGRAAARMTLGLDADGPVWLWMGLQANTKGLDRTLKALAASSDARLLVCGLEPESSGGASMTRLATILGVRRRVRWLGFMDSHALITAMRAADLLVHPSREDVTGTVILEALTNGLPVVTTEVCGYGEHVRAADAGTVLSQPFRLANLVLALAGATPERLKSWSANALAYARRDDLYTGIERAADLVLEAPPPRSKA